MSMTNDYNEFDDFFPSSDLNNLSFYLYCPSITEEEKLHITKKILENKGVSKQSSNKK